MQITRLTLGRIGLHLLCAALFASVLLLVSSPVSAEGDTVNLATTLTTETITMPTNSTATTDITISSTGGDLVGGFKINITYDPVLVTPINSQTFPTSCGIGCTPATGACNVLDADTIQCNYAFGPGAGGTDFLVYQIDWQSNTNIGVSPLEIEIVDYVDTGGADLPPPAIVDGAIGIPTAIELAGFSAEAGTFDGVVVLWETASEWDHAGFNLYRSASPDFDSGSESTVLLNEVLIAAQGSIGQGASYQYEDVNVPSGVWYYFLEDVDVSGHSTLHEPVMVDLSVPTSAALTTLAGADGSNPSIALLLLLLCVVVVGLVKTRGLGNCDS